MNEQHSNRATFTALLPNLPDTDYQALKENIAAHGVRVPVVHDQHGQTIDGFHRERAARELGLDVPVEVREYESDAARRADAIALNLARRNLTAEQKAEVRRTQQAVYFELRQDGMTQAGAAALVGVAQRTGSHWEAGRSRISNSHLAKANNPTPADLPEPEQAASVLTITPKPADRREKLTADETAAIVAWADNGETQQWIADQLGVTQGRVAQLLKRHRKEQEQKAEREANAAKVEEATDPEDLTQLEGTFSTIVIDPPWSPDDEGDVNQFGRTQPTYQTMPLEEIRRLPIRELAAPNAHLYIWITNRSLEKGFGLMRDWDFRYITCLTWVKPSIGVGNYFRNSTEHVLFGVRGSLPIGARNLPTAFHADRPGRHSAKPDAFYEMALEASPGPRLDFFARKQRDGWHTYGEDGLEVAA